MVLSNCLRNIHPVAPSLSLETRSGTIPESHYPYSDTFLYALASKLTKSPNFSKSERPSLNGYFALSRGRERETENARGGVGEGAEELGKILQRARS